MLLHGCAYLGSALFVSDFLHPESSTSPRSHVWGDFAIPVCGTACLESSLLALDSVHLGFPLLLHGAACPGSFMLVLESVHLSFFLLLRSFSCPELVPFVLDFSHLDSMMLLRSVGRLDSSTSACSATRSGSLPFALDFAIMGPFPPSQGRACSELVLLVLDLTHPESSLLARSFA